MAQLILYSNPYSGQTMAVPAGFSWTALLFGPCVPLCRGHFSAFFIMLIVYVVFSAAWLTTAWLVLGVVFGFAYNGWHEAHLRSCGWRPGGPE